MLLDFIPYDRISHHENERTYRALQSVVRLLQRKLGVLIGYDARAIAFGNPELAEVVKLGEILRKKGVIKGYGPAFSLDDEPRLRIWSAICNVPNEHITSGASFESDEAALTAALAESLERYIWLTQSDFFRGTVHATVVEMQKKGAFIAPEKWVGFSEEQRTLATEKQLRADAPYKWVRAESLVTGKAIYIPAQLVSGRDDSRALHAGEPVIRFVNTNGLATWPTKNGARLAGVLEVIEREAFMVMWLNQLTLPRIDIEMLAHEDPALLRMLNQCDRYRLKVHAVELLTDAPTHAICAVIEDLSGVPPRFVVGLKAHRSLTVAIQKAVTEALRARRGYRTFVAEGKTWDDTTPIADIGHRDRLYYWGVHGDALSFMTQGPLKSPLRSWDKLTEEAHFAEILKWCQKEELECVAVSLGSSSMNPTSLSIEMVAMPDLQPTYLREHERAFGGTRWRTIPERFGYVPLEQPFSARPHPFS